MQALQILRNWQHNTHIELYIFDSFVAMQKIVPLSIFFYIFLTLYHLVFSFFFDFVYAEQSDQSFVFLILYPLHHYRKLYHL